MKPVAFELAQPATVAEAARLLREDGAPKLMAGNQSLGPMLNLRLVRPTLLVDLRRCAELGAVEDDGEAILFGAGITHAMVEDGRVPDPTPGWLAPVARRIAYRAVRNRGTIAGSLAHADPAADWVTVMTCLGAEVVVRNADGERAVALPDLFLGAYATALAPDEIVVRVRVPKRSTAARFGYWKYCRKVGEFPLASAAVLHDPERDEHRVVIGATGGPPGALAEPAAVLRDPARGAVEIRARCAGEGAERCALLAAALRRAIAALDRPDLAEAA